MTGPGPKHLHFPLISEMHPEAHGSAVVVGIAVETGSAPGSAPGMSGFAGNAMFEMLYACVPWTNTPP